MRKLPISLFLFASIHVYATNLNTLIMPASRLAAIKAVLPQVTNNSITDIFNSPQTLWYDEHSMARSYQDSLGVSSNNKWPDLVAASEEIIGIYHDRSKHRWQFPFATTAGTDDSTNLDVANFVYLPQVNDQVQTVSITTKIGNDNRTEWTWRYPVGTTFGEVVFITDGANLLPVEIRTRTRYALGWSMNVFRPFPRAKDLAKEIKELRPYWSSQPNLKRMVEHLENNSTLTSASLSAKGKIASIFQQDGYLDILPDFEDPQLVKQLLRTTVFRSAYDTSWKENGSQKTYAASTRSPLSIVPTNYTAGIIQVTDESCMRCHSHTEQNVSEYIFDLYLYGQIWGMDGIFSFHPYQESLYPKLRLDGFDNRALNPKLKQAGVFRTTFEASYKN
jgi:hypothetical protein